MLRYWEDLENTFEVSWSDAVDKENVLVEHLIKISEIPTEISKDEELSLPIVNSNLYSITLYRTKLWPKKITDSTGLEKNSHSFKK